jgi:cobalt/nickel transport system permease protein
LLGGIVALQLGAFSVVIETVLSGRSELPFRAFLLVMQPIHLGIGIVEGFVTAGVINVIRSSRPEILEGAADARPLASGVSPGKVFAGVLIVALLTGGALSWFASSRPDGLEWSMERVFGRPDLPEEEGGISKALRSVQEKTAFLPEYDLKRTEGTAESRKNSSWPEVRSGASVSGIVGSLMVLAIVLLVGIVIRAVRRRSTLG